MRGEEKKKKTTKFRARGTKVKNTLALKDRHMAVKGQRRRKPQYFKLPTHLWPDL